jgi:xanthine dehydrogenase small subunit
MSDSISTVRFYFRGEWREAQGLPITRTVLQHLREDLHCTGTKEGCAEGDCGACTVVVGERDAQAPGGLALKTVNSCIQFLPTLHGKALFTVEDLKTMAGDGLHPVQQAMVDCHGSQCGFCTPGFVMSLFCAYEQHMADGTRPSRSALADELSGNLCRCTGYRPILDAGERMFSLPSAQSVRLDRTALAEALGPVAATGFATSGPSPHPAPAGHTARTDRFWAPVTLDEFAALRQAHPQARLLAGSTDIGLWVTKQFRDVGDLLYIGNVAELRRIRQSDGWLEIGAAASLEDAWAALAQAYPDLGEVWRRFAGKPVRHAGTMGGNVANGSPIGDSAPALMALGAQVVLRLGSAERNLPIEDFYLGYMQNALQPGEFLMALRVPLPRPGQQVRVYKISRRFDCDISAVCMGLSVELEPGTTGEAPGVKAIRSGVGGMAATVQRARHAEAALAGQPFTEARIQAAMQALGQDFTPLSDMRASAAYRLQVAQNLLYKFWLETGPRALPSQAVNAWHPMHHHEVASA